MTITVPEAFLAAADKIEECGWIRWRFGDCEGGFCAAGALHEVTDFGPAVRRGDPASERALYEVYLAATQYAAARVRARFPVSGWAALSHYNDAEGRTKEEVVAFLRECAASYSEVSDGA